VEYQYTKDWFNWAPNVWEQLTPHLPERKNFLEYCPIKRGVVREYKGICPVVLVKKFLSLPLGAGEPRRFAFIYLNSHTDNFKPIAPYVLLSSHL